MAEAKKAGTDVISVEDQLAAMALAISEAEKPSGSWLSFKGARLSLDGNAIPSNKLAVVVIQSLFENQWYKDPYDVNNIQPPHCFAFAEKEEDLKPHPSVKNPIHPTCKGCPKGEWKSATSGSGRGKACKNVRRMALISYDDVKDGKIENAHVAMAKIPVTSVKNWSTYASQVSGILKMDPIQVATELSVEPHPKNQIEIGFKLLDKVDKSAWAALLNKRRDTTTLIYAPYDEPTEAAPAAPESKKY